MYTTMMFRYYVGYLIALMTFLYSLSLGEFKIVICGHTKVIYIIYFITKAEQATCCLHI